MAIAKVVVDLSLDREFDYLVPEHLAAAVQLGSRVNVPFGKRFAMGYVVGFVNASKFPHLKPIESVVGKKPMLQERVLELARWIAEYYCCSVEQAVGAVLPEVVQKGQMSWKERLFVRLTEDGRTVDIEKVRKRAAKQAEILEALRKVVGRLSQPPSGKDSTPETGALQRSDAHPSSGIFAGELLERDRGSHATLKAMEKKGWITVGAKTDERDPFRDEHFVATDPLVLTPEQQQSLDVINRSLESEKPSVILLHGVTGSGKTEVYLQAIARALEQGKGAIVLVPEIALTPQTVERFKARFSTKREAEMGGSPSTATEFSLKTTDGVDAVPPNALPSAQVAVLHSNLSEGERHDEWHKISEGRARIVIGPRSAVFAPVQNLGLIVVDEEHETTYKQDDAPRYNARDVAVVRGKIEGATVVLGSATPSLESFYNARKKKYVLSSLPRRVDHKVMPVVRVVDMRQEAFRQKGVQIFSEKLKSAIASRLEKREQVMLFLNRRGFATHMFCPKCGYVAKCPNCSISLTYHRPKERLMCHVCGHVAPAPRVCPVETCRDSAIRYAGLGTQKVEETLGKLFPKANIARMDSDTMTRKDLYRKTLGAFRTGKTDILVGTQMIAKGLHFPNVTLVGIIYADMALHLQDFRSSERTFSLLVQVSGRAGRGDVPGEVIVQTYTPHHPAIQYARRHEVTEFCEQEMEWREELRYPPVTHLLCITLRSRNEQKASFFAQATGKALREKLEEAVPGAMMAGPMSAPLSKMKGFFRFQITLRAVRVRPMSAFVRETVAGIHFPKDVRVAIDVDPMWLM